MDGAERFETVIVGGGQAGLAVGYHLARQGRDFVILDANERTGDSWRAHWDSLRLFTPARYDGLPGLRFPGPGWSFPTKDEMGDYLESYATRFELPVRTGVSVVELARDGGAYVLTSGDRRVEADHVVVATGANRTPRVPRFASELDPGIVQLHSSDYRAPSQLRDGAVLVVGLGNSGAEIGFEVAQTHRTFLAGTEPGHIPVRPGSIPFRFVVRVIRFLGHRVLTLNTPIGRKARPKFLAQATPLIRIRPKELAAAGVERGPRVAGVRGGLPVLEDGRTLDVANVIWCTGYRLDFSWIDLPVFGEDGEPRHVRGVVTDEPGLYFVGLRFLYAATSETIPGVGRDAQHIAKHIASRTSGRPRRTDLVAGSYAA